MRAWIKKLKRRFPLDKFLPLTSYSQEGEDMVLRGFFEDRKHYKGFFIDIGAHHPFRFSNTAYFYKRGWRGINIEANPEAMRAFSWFRRRDTNLNVGVSGTGGKLTFYCFNEPALNGFSASQSALRNNKNNYRITHTLSIQTYPLADILNRHLPEGQKIDFLTIDAEGLDFQILQSNDWNRYRPEYLLVEEKVELEDLPASPLYLYLKEKGYGWIAKTKRTLFFKLLTPQASPEPFE